MAKFKLFVKFVTRHVMHFLKKSYKDNISALAGQSSFFIILSAVPFLMFVFSIVSMLTGRDPSSFQFPRLKSAEGGEFENLLRIISEFIEESIRRSSSGTAIVTAVVALWSAGKGMYCITEGISRIYKLPNKSIWLIKRVYAMGYTVVMLLMMLICVAVIALTFIFAERISEWYSGMILRRALFVLGYAALMLLMSFLMTLALKMYLFRKLTNKRRCTVRALYPGMILTVIAWNALTFGLIIYIRNFATSSIYGSLGSVFMIMLWIYFMMYILLYGVQLDYVYRKWFSSRRVKRRLKEAKAALDKQEPQNAELLKMTTRKGDKK